MNTFNSRSSRSLAPLLFSAITLLAQNTEVASTTVTTVPRLIRVESEVRLSNGPAPADIENVRLLIYGQETGGTPLWQETQTVAVDAHGRYSVLLGSTQNDGLPPSLFVSAEPRWLEVRFPQSGEADQPRHALTSVAYAFKAADADTLGGRPASAYLLAPGASRNGTEQTAEAAGRSKGLIPLLNSGTINQIGKFVNSTDLGNTSSFLYDNGTRVGLGTFNPQDFFHVVFNDTSGGVTGYAVQNLSSSANAYSGMLFYDQNGALGQFQGFNNSTHEYRMNNIAPAGYISFMLHSVPHFTVTPGSDVDVLQNLRSFGSLLTQTSGPGSTGIGVGALNVNSGAGAGQHNTALGWTAAFNTTTGEENSALGLNALFANVTSGSSTAVGNDALENSTGGGNTALGFNAGSNVTTGNSNIMIGNSGLSGDSGVTRIGDSQVATFIAGISGVTTGLPGATVIIDSAGQLGTRVSSRRYKEDISDMKDSSSGLMRLRPVTFRYSRPFADGSKPIEYGLVAEEVAEVYPDLVVKNSSGQIESVQYEKLDPMLVNELQKEHQKAERQDETIRSQNRLIRSQDEKLHAQAETIRSQKQKKQSLEARLAAIEALLSNKAATSAVPAK